MNNPTKKIQDFNDGYADAVHRTMGILVREQLTDQGWRKPATRAYLDGVLKVLGEITEQVRQARCDLHKRIETSLQERTLEAAQAVDTDFGFWEAAIEEWPENNSWLVTVGDKYDDEIEVEVHEDDDDATIQDAVLKAITGRSEAAASVEAERDAERPLRGDG